MLYAVSPKWTTSWWPPRCVSLISAESALAAGAVSMPKSPNSEMVTLPSARSGAGARVGPKTADQLAPPSELTR